MENGTRLYPQSTSNPNVPKDAFIIAEVATMSGEIVTTYYATKEGDTLSVTDWSGQKPRPAYKSELYKLTGDTPPMLYARWDLHYSRL